MSHGKAAAAGDDDGVLDLSALDALRRQHDTRSLIPRTNWQAKADVLATVTDQSGLRWAHEIIALHEAGLYPSPTGVDMARAALKVAA